MRITLTICLLASLAGLFIAKVRHELHELRTVNCAVGKLDTLYCAKYGIERIQ